MIRAIPRWIGNELFVNGVAVLTYEHYVWETPTSSPSERHCMADVDFPAASRQLRPPPNHRILLAARLVPDRGIFERRHNRKYNWASVSADEVSSLSLIFTCKSRSSTQVFILLMLRRKRIWIDWTAEFMEALPSWNTVKAGAKTSIKSDFQGRLPRPMIIATDDKAERRLCNTKTESQFMAAHEVKD